MIDTQASRAIQLEKDLTKTIEKFLSESGLKIKNWKIQGIYSKDGLKVKILSII